MQSEVETLHLLSLGNPDAHDCLEYHEDNEGNDSAIDDRREDAPDLDPHLGKVTLKQTRGAADRFYCESCRLLCEPPKAPLPPCYASRNQPLARPAARVNYSLPCDDGNGQVPPCLPGLPELPTHRIIVARRTESISIQST